MSPAEFGRAFYVREAKSVQNHLNWMGSLLYRRLPDRLRGREGPGWVIGFLIGVAIGTMIVTLQG